MIDLYYYTYLPYDTIRYDMFVQLQCYRFYNGFVSFSVPATRLDFLEASFE